MRQHVPVPPKKTITYRKFNEIDYEKVNHELSCVNFEEISNELDANETFNKLHHRLMCILDEHAPKKQNVIRNADFQLWIFLPPALPA